MHPTYQLYIKSIDNKEELGEWIYNYTGLYQKLHNNFELSEDKDTITEWRERFGVSAYMYECCKADVKMSLDAQKEIKKSKVELIKELKKEIESLKVIKRATKYEKAHRLKLEKRLINTQKSLDKDVCFGGVHRLREVTKLKQLQTKTDKQVKLLTKKENEYKQKRKRNLFLIGRANEAGSRCVDFHLDEGYVIFKPNKDTKIRIDFYPYKGKARQNDLAKIQKMVEQKLLALTIRLDGTKICLSFDIEKLNGFAFDEQEFNRLRKDKSKEETKQIKIQLYKEQKEKKLKGKVHNRCAGVDLNPDDIALSIIDVNEDTNELDKVVFTRRYDLRKYTEAEYKDKKTSQYMRNKHKTELQMIYADIFRWCEHYKVSYFGVEDLKEITTSNLKSNSTQFNRKTKNVWNRAMQEFLIEKKCCEKGIVFERVNPMYSSLIGNVLHYQYHDCIGASIEIARRSFTKYKKNCQNFVYPAMGNYNNERLTHLANVEVPVRDTWVSLYRELSKRKYGIEGWWRNKSSTVGKNLYSSKSMITYHCL